MNKHKLSLIISVGGILLLIFIATVLELNKTSKEKEYKFAVKTIETATIKCINDKKCEIGKITVKELIDKKYLVKLKNPNTKDYFNEKSYMVYPDLAFYDVEE